jgi:coenzyme F420-reducing hydrogenase beta subunit
MQIFRNRKEKDMTIEDVHSCVGCALCADICPQKAITFLQDKNGYLHPIISHDLCVQCNLCYDTCIAENEAGVIRHSLEEEKAYAAWTTDDELIKRSASGGVFAQVATDFLRQPDSVVYGATLTEDGDVRHIAVSREADIALLQNSKYKQSNLSDVYVDVREQLRAGKRVLFSGTPCQIAAVYAFCGRHEHLYTAEILCHGVPSNYLAELAVRLENARRIWQYRTKSLGWARGNRTVYESKDGSVYEKDRLRNDFHYRAYALSSLLRDSCFSCPFARAERVADITMGDFWGLDKQKYDHPAGVSVLLVNSEKGRQLTSSDHLYRKPTTWDEITRLNQNLFMPTNYSTFRLSDRVAELRQWPLWKQKFVLQNGSTNKWLNYAYERLFDLCTWSKRRKARRETDSKRAELLRRVHAMQPKVGILTTYFASNFGAMLQPYALKRVLENEGCQVEFIRYKQPAVYAGHLPLAWRKIKGRSLSAIAGIIAAFPMAYIQYRRLQRFRKLYLQRDGSFSNVIPYDKDYYIFGSDQIWNPKNTNGFDDIYFGAFPAQASARKIAYAASGEKIAFTKDECAYLASHLANFDAISVREESLKRQLETNISSNALPPIEVTLDPTLLATKDILDELPVTHPLGGKPFAFCYLLRDSLAFLPKIHAYAKGKGLPLVVLTSTPKKEAMLYAAKHRDVHYFGTAGMDLFLGAERYAEYVFTPSFHGSVFAIINHKPLFALQLGDGLDTRAADLLRGVGMNDRLVTIHSNWDACSPIDYEAVEKKLGQLRKQSLEYLRKNMIK